MYKIVTTIENGQTYVTCAPVSWIKNHTLYWPPKNFNQNEINKLRLKSIPPEKNWRQLKCLIKECDTIDNFQDGLEWEYLFASQDDYNSGKRCFIKRSYPEVYNSDNSSKTIAENEEISIGSFQATTSQLCSTNNESITYANFAMKQEEPIDLGENIANASVLNKPNNSDDSAKEQDVQLLAHEVQNLKRSVNILLDRTATINAKIDKLLENHTTPSTSTSGFETQCRPTEITAILCNSPNISIDSFNFPLNTIDEVNRLEATLADNKFRKRLVLAVLNNVGKNDGVVDGHYLIKVGNKIFSDALLNKYTFKGISRSGQQKENFSDLKNVLCFFQNVLYSVCEFFDYKRTEKYVQTKLLRHAGSRVKRFRQRLNKAMKKPHLDEHLAKQDFENSESASEEEKSYDADEDHFFVQTDITENISEI